MARGGEHFGASAVLCGPFALARGTLGDETECFMALGRASAVLRGPFWRWVVLPLFYPLFYLCSTSAVGCSTSVRPPFYLCSTSSSTSLFYLLPLPLFYHASASGLFCLYLALPSSSTLPTKLTYLTFYRCSACFVVVPPECSPSRTAGFCLFRHAAFKYYLSLSMLPHFCRGVSPPPASCRGSRLRRGLLVKGGGGLASACIVQGGLASAAARG